MAKREEVSGRRRLDVEQRRALILDAAGALFAETPYEQVSTAAISRASGSSESLLFHYFGTKAQLYAAVVQASLARLRAAQSDAEAALPAGVPVRDRVRASLEVYLDHLARDPRAGAVPLRGGAEPVAAQGIRAQARDEDVQVLADLLGIGDWPRHSYAVWGYFGFLDQACEQWVERGCADAERDPLIEAALGALEGALGDWRV